MAGAIGKLPDGLRPPPRLVRGETVTCGGFAATPRLLPQKEGNHPRQRMVEDMPLRCSKVLSQSKGLSSVSLTADSSRYQGSQGRPLPQYQHEKTTATAVVFSSPRRMSAAALSAAVDAIKLIRNAPTFRRNQLCRSSQLKRQPLFGREREEGKDSHSRQWRLSMAVFLNRNKRPQAAPIEVAELLSEKPPPSHTPTSVPYSFSTAVLRAVRARNIIA